MKKLGMLSLIVGSLWLGSCSDDDKDFMLDVNRMTGVDWYYNRTTSKNYSSFSDENVLEINRFDKSGEIKGIDLRGVIRLRPSDSARRPTAHSPLRRTRP